MFIRIMVLYRVSSDIPLVRRFEGVACAVFLGEKPFHGVWGLLVLRILLFSGVLKVQEPVGRK